MFYSWHFSCSTSKAPVYITNALWIFEGEHFKDFAIMFYFHCFQAIELTVLAGLPQDLEIREILECQGSKKLWRKCQGPKSECSGNPASTINHDLTGCIFGRKSAWLHNGMGFASRAF